MPWWRQKRTEVLAALKEQGSAFVYDLDSVRAAARALRSMKSLGRVHYSMKANSSPQVLQAIRAEGVDFECVSRGEVERALQLFPDLDPLRILYTPNFAPRDEYAWAFERGVRVTVDNLYMLTAWPDLFRGREIFARIDTGVGRGHHHHVRTAGAHSKFGVPVAELKQFSRYSQELGVRIVGLQAHVGSGIFDVSNWEHTARQLADLAQHFTDVKVIDVGGGLGVPERGDQPGVDLQKLDTLLTAVRAEYPRLEFWMEPGRYLVAAAGVLLARVTQLKSKGEVRYIGVTTGMNSLIRPALYGSYHEIVNLTRADEAADGTGQCRGSDLRKRRRTRARPSPAAHARGRRASDRECRRVWSCNELALQSSGSGGGAVHLKRVTFRKLIWRTVLGAVAVVVLAAGVYFIYLDREVTHQFEGRRWTLPAQIFAAPLELYAGLPLSQADLERELQRLQYRRVERLERPGTYREQGARVDVALRPARFADESRPASILSIEVDVKGIESLHDSSGKDVAIVRLEPLLIGSIFPIHGEDRIIVTPQEVPPLLPAALKAVEDRNFDSHHGVDPAGIARALWVNVRAGQIEQGGSTLTQQLVKSYFLDSRRTAGRKLREAAMALALEAHFSKADLMNAYINEIFLGQDGDRAIHGFGLASQFYFGKPLSELDLSEIAVLVSIVRGPSYYDPRRHPDRVKDPARPRFEAHGGAQHHQAGGSDRRPPGSPSGS